MRQHKLLCLGLVAVLLLSACGNAETTNAALPYSAQGSDAVQYVTAEEGFIDQKTILPDTFPIYKKAYPTGQEGPLFEVTDALKSQMEKQLEDFLSILALSEQTGSISTDSEYTWAVTYRDDQYEMFSYPDGINIITSLDQAGGNLIDHPIVRAAVQYVGIQSPEVTFSKNYDVSGLANEDRCLISEKADDLLQKTLNRTFSAIQVTHYKDTDEVLVKIHREPVPDEAKKCQIISYQEGLRQALDAVPGASDQAVKADIVYRTLDDPELLVPCYRFFFDKTDTMPATSVDIVMTDG